jgi:hypothetical protein
MLSLFDTLHDFWKERKLVKNDEEDEDDEPIDEGKQQRLQNYLVNFLYGFTKKQVPRGSNLENINILLNSLTGGFVTSVTSKYERSIVKFYEKASSSSGDLYFDTTEGITYGEIINAWDEWQASGKPGGQLPPLWIDYANSYGASNILEISLGQDKVYNSYGMVQRMGKQSIIANFILNYMFPGFTLADNTGYITFDAKTGVVGKTFRDIDNVYNLVTPGNISDSAPTSFNSLSNRNEFIFPSATGEHAFTSNMYTKNSVLIKFSDMGFSNKNPYGFALNINNKVFPFSSTQKQGPSVNYLVDLILTPNIATPTLSTIINITNKENDAAYSKLLSTDGLPLDIKRGGDYEQVNCAVAVEQDRGHVIMSTIDILCSLYARLRRQNTILHVNEKLTLFRFPSKISVDPVKQRLQKIKYDSIKTIQALQIISGFISNNIYKDIADLKANLINFIKNGFFIDKTRTIKKNIPVGALSALENIMTLLVKIRMVDILISLTKLTINAPDITIDQINAAIPILEAYVQNPTPEQADNVDATNKGFANTNINNDIQMISSVFNLTTNQRKVLNEGGNLLELNHDFYKVVQNGTNSYISFNYLGECKTINFSNKLYAIIFDILNKLDRMINSRSGRNAEKNLYNNLHLMDYFSNVNLLMESFNNTDLGEAVYNALQPETTATEAVTAWYNGLPNVLTQIYSNPSITQYLSTMQGGRIRHKKQKIVEMKGGKYADIVQYYNLSDLLRDISGRAAYFLESIITTEHKNISSLTDLKQMLTQKYANALISTIAEIKFDWLNGLMSIQTNIDDSYTYTPTAAEYIIITMLSMYYDNATHSNDADIGELLDDISAALYAPFISQNMVAQVSRRSTRGAVTQTNDMAALIFTSPIPAEVIIIIVLTLIDNTMQEKNGNAKEKQGHFYQYIKSNNIPSNFFENAASWNDLPRYLYVYISFAINDTFPTKSFDLLRGGFLTKKNKTRRNKNKRNNKKRSSNKKKTMHRK